MSEENFNFEEDFVYLEDHASCCGITHIVEFGSNLNEINLKRLDNILERAKNRKVLKDEVLVQKDHLFEVTLTDQQMIAWAPVLKERGFELLYRWFNGNSGNYCNLLVFRVGKENSPPPYVW